MRVSVLGKTRLPAVAAATTVARIAYTAALPHAAHDRGSLQSEEIARDEVCRPCVRRVVALGGGQRATRCLALAGARADRFARSFADAVASPYPAPNAD